MKPKPFSPLNHFTVPCAMLSAPRRLVGFRTVRSPAGCFVPAGVHPRTPKLDDLLHLTGKLPNLFRGSRNFFGSGASARFAGAVQRRSAGRGLRGAEPGQAG